jgi:tetratricopeptide (TPR) repeat protein
MNAPNEGQPLDQGVATQLAAYADQFEFAVRDGHDFVAAAVANGIVQILIRFYSSALLKIPTPEAAPGLGPRSLKSLSAPTSAPDPVYLGVVRPAIKEFKEALASGDVVHAIQALTPTGILSELSATQKELIELETKLYRAGGIRRLEFLPRLAKLAFWAGDTNKAEQYAKEAVSLDPPGNPFSDGEGTHDGNMVIGLIALQRGEAEQAKRHLIESSRTSGSGYMSMTGPNLSLANELLKRDEHQAVIEYLRECRRFWADGRKTLDSWIEKIGSGNDPQFDPLHFTL